jgi:DNA polymerase-3 subunit epsilon
MTGPIFIDCETSGLDPSRHEVWEIAAVEEDGTEHIWRVEPDLTFAEPGALRINGYYDRTAAIVEWDQPEDVAGAIAYLTADKILAGAVPSFDAGFLELFLRANGYCPAWSHRLLCVETYAAGRLGALPVSLSDTARALGIPIPDGRHSALVDARLARDVYLAVAFQDAEIVDAPDPGVDSTTAIPATT